VTDYSMVSNKTTLNRTASSLKLPPSSYAMVLLCHVNVRSGQVSQQLLYKIAMLVVLDLGALQALCAQDFL